MPGLQVNPEGAARLQDECDSGRQLAIRIGVDPATTLRVLSGRQAPSHRFIAGLINGFGVRWFGRVFDIVGD